MRSCDEKISLDQAADLIAARDLRKGDDLRMAIDRTRKRIEYAVQKGQLARLADETFSLGDVIGWAKTVLPDIHFDDLPANANAVASSAGMDVKVRTVRAIGIVMPTTLEACHAEINRLTSELHTAAIKVAALERQVAALTPDAERTRTRIQKATESARKRWRGREKG